MSDSLLAQGLHPNAPLGRQGRMSPTLALIWKQCADLSQAFAVLSASNIATLLLVTWLSRRPYDFYGLTLYSVILFSCGFALAACFVSFVTEFESSTRDFLGNLPVSSVLVGVVKQLCAIVIVALFFSVQVLARLIVMWLYQAFGDVGFELSHLHWGGSLSATQHYWVAALVVTAVFVSCLICCSFWSTSWMSVVSALPMTWLLCAAGICYGESMRYPVVVWGYPLASKVLLVTALAAAISIPLFWLRRRPMLRKFSLDVGPMDHAEDDFFWASLPSRIGIPTPGWLAMPGRDRFPAMCWQSVRQQAMLPFLALLAVGSMAWLFASVLIFNNVNSQRVTLEAMQIGLVFVMTITGYGFGWGALYRDKLNSNFNFFQQHREHGRELLLARVLFPWLLAWLTVAVGGTVIYLFTECDVSIWPSLLAWLAAFSVTLMWSMVFRSFIYALAIGLVLSLTTNGFIFSWLTYERFAHHWMVILPLVWLTTCFAFAPAWLSGRRTIGWVVWITFISLATYSVPLWSLACWYLGLEPS